jgi:hypothetical protein
MKMYERVTKLLETELLRSNGEQQSPTVNEHRDDLLLPMNDAITRTNTQMTDRSLAEAILRQEEKP